MENNFYFRSDLQDRFDVTVISFFEKAEDHWIRQDLLKIVELGGKIMIPIPAHRSEATSSLFTLIRKTEAIELGELIFVIPSTITTGSKPYRFGFNELYTVSEKIIGEDRSCCMNLNKNSLFFEIHHDYFPIFNELLIRYEKVLVGEILYDFVTKNKAVLEEKGALSLISKIIDVKKEKNNYAGAQQYEKAANLRDIEKDLEEQLNLILSTIEPVTT